MVKPHVLRYWEQEFPQLKPSKRRGNRRYYQREDVIMVRNIRELLYDEGYTIIGARIQLEQLLKQPKSQKAQEYSGHEINFVVEPEEPQEYQSDYHSDYDTDVDADYQTGFKTTYERPTGLKDNSQSIFNPAEFLENQAAGVTDAANEYCTLTELEQIAEQLKVEQAQLNKSHNNRMKSYKMTMDEIVFELKDILSEIRTNQELLIEA